MNQEIESPVEVDRRCRREAAEREIRDSVLLAAAADLPGGWFVVLNQCHDIAYKHGCHVVFLSLADGGVVFNGPNQVSVGTRERWRPLCGLGDVDAASWALHLQPHDEWVTPKLDRHRMASEAIDRWVQLHSGSKLGLMPDSELQSIASGIARLYGFDVEVLRGAVGLYERVAGRDYAAAHPLLRYFTFAHLPPNLAKVSEPICDLARQLDELLPAGDEKSVALRKLLEAKDAAVRSVLP